MVTYFLYPFFQYFSLRLFSLYDDCWKFICDKGLLRRKHLSHHFHIELFYTLICPLESTSFFQNIFYLFNKHDILNIIIKLSHHLIYKNIFYLSTCFVVEIIIPPAFLFVNTIFNF